MEVHFKPDVQAKLEQMARESGRPSDELVEDAVIGYFDELAQTREMLDRRFDDLESGSVAPIDGDEAYRRLMENGSLATCGKPRFSRASRRKI